MLPRGSPSGFSLWLPHTCVAGTLGQRNGKSPSANVHAFAGGDFCFCWQTPMATSAARTFHEWRNCMGDTPVMRLKNLQQKAELGKFSSSDI